MKHTKLTDCYTLSNGVEIPCIGYGTFQMKPCDDTVSSIVSALEAGYRHIDTAEGYGNERCVGDAIKRSDIKREEVFITSKLANACHGYDATHEAFRLTLENLQTDYLDLFLIHWPCPVACRENWKEANHGTWKAMEELYEAGKIRAIGVSNFYERHYEPLMEHARIAPMVNQLSLSPGLSQDEICKYSREHNMLLEAYSPLGQGFVLGLDKMQAFAQKYQKTASQICVRWSLQMGFLPLPKSVSASRIRENADVFDFCISEEDMRTIAVIDSSRQVRDPDTVNL